MASKEEFYIRVVRKTDDGEREETFLPVSGYHYTMVTPVGQKSFDFGITNEDIFGGKKGHWTASILPYGIKLVQANTRKAAEEAVLKLSEDGIIDKAIAYAETEFRQNGKGILDKALERDGKGAI